MLTPAEQRKFDLAKSHQPRADDRIDFLGAEQDGTLVPVIFILDWLPYRRGETASIAPELASRLVPTYAEPV